MHIAYIIVTVVAAAWVGFSAFSLLQRAEFVTAPLVQYGVPESWWTPLGLLKGAGAIGLIAGLFLPVIGIAAAIGLILYFLGAVITNIRARSFKTIPFPLLYLVPVAVAMGLGLAA
ncbi:DoxX family protein [Nocardia yamanashiensis]|uniref:DoxX family protein n=1 Tax=Nocardia yamanashiensis TaxID=209247 RepID=UPI000832B721|nr:DoxX family protein [Nocardia yamanashiensis]UGT41631.1 DoxX family protein [Nocardia yamanashiensis]